jgi:hypothetical protein
MGLYDTVQCEYPLPDPEYQREVFQTTDLGCMLAQYRIDAQGRLWVTHGVLRFRRRGKTPPKPPPPEDARYHGDFCFYTYAQEEMVEFQARFTHGVLEWIRRVEDPEPGSVDSLERLARAAQYLEQERAAQLEALLKRLEALDPEVAKEAVEVFGDRAQAARWLASRPLSLARRSPYEELARGQRKEILNVLGRFLHGIPM